jgi:hypothetical protein
VPVARRLFGDFDEAAEGVREPHLLHRPAIRIQQPRARVQVRQALRARDRHVQAVAREEESLAAEQELLVGAELHEARRGEVVVEGECLPESERAHQRKARGVYEGVLALVVAAEPLQGSVLELF